MTRKIRKFAQDMKFSDIPGQGTAKETLRGSVDSGHVPHAVMISGPAGVGKMLLARAFAQYLHCEHHKDGEPCGVCNSCRMHQELNHPDLKFFFPYNKQESKGRKMSADCSEEWLQMLRQFPSMPEDKWLELLDAGNSQPIIYVPDAEEIVRSDAMPPYTSRHKIFIIWQPERMNLEAANKLLKVIEEPSEGTIFVLVSNNELQVLPTIFSRVQRIGTGRLADSEIAGYLVSRHGFSPDAAARLARLCEGNLIRADQLGAEQGETDEFLALYQDIMRSAYAKRVRQLRALSEKIAGFGREKIKRFLEYMARMIRENFIFNLRMPQLYVLTPEEEEFSTKFSPFVNHGNVEDFLRETDRALRDISRNANGRIVLFDYFIYIIVLLHRKPSA